MLKRILVLVICASFCISILPVLSLSSFADNSGFLQIRIYYKTTDALGNWSSEKSAMISDNSSIDINTYGMTNPLQITRIFFSTFSDETSYFQFDVCFGGQIPVNGTWPSASYNNNIISFSTSGGVEAYGFPTSDKTPFSYVDEPGTAYIKSINCSSSRCFFGKVTSSGYLTFNNPVTITFRPGDSPAQQTISMFFRHLVIGQSNASYLANLEDYISNIDTNVNDIADWMEEEHNAANDFLDAGGSQLLSDSVSFAPSAFSVIGALFGARNIISVNPGSYQYQDRFWTEWAHNQMQGVQTRTIEDDYIDFYSWNKEKYWGGDD